MDAKQKAVIRAAKAVGAPRVKGADASLVRAAEVVQSVVQSLSGRGRGNNAPAGSIYKLADINRVSQALRSVRKLAAGLPEGDIKKLVRGYLGGCDVTLTYLFDSVTGEEPNGSAHGISANLDDLAEDMGKVIKILKRSP